MTLGAGGRCGVSAARTCAAHASSAATCRCASTASTFLLRCARRDTSASRAASSSTRRSATRLLSAPSSAAWCAANRASLAASIMGEVRWGVKWVWSRLRCNGKMHVVSQMESASWERKGPQ